MLSSKCVIGHKCYTCLELNLSSAISLGKVTEKAVLHLSENSCLKSVVFSVVPPISGEPSLSQYVVHCVIDHRIQGSKLYSCNNS